MSLDYFRPRDRFDFSKDSLDIGNAISWDKESFLKHFFLRFFLLKEDRWNEFYQRHLSYHLNLHPESSEEIFFKVLWDLIETRLKSLVRKDIYTSKNHIRDQREINQLKQFTQFLVTKDTWNWHETDKAIIVRMQTEMLALQHRITKQEDTITKQATEIKLFKSLETKEHINIQKDYLLTLLDIFIEMQKLLLDNGKELVFSPTQAVWMKMICKFFTLDNKPISYETLKRYFSPDPENKDNVKHSPIPANKKLFEIVPAKRRS